MSPRNPTLAEIASCVSGYDPDALPVAQAQEFIARLVPRVQAVEKLAIRSALGRGSEFTLVLPVRIGQAAKSAAEPVSAPSLPAPAPAPAARPVAPVVAPTAAAPAPMRAPSSR